MTSLTATFDLPLGPDAASAARRAAHEVLRAWGLADPHWCYDAVLVVSELVGNAVRHAGDQVTLALAMTDGRLTVAVTDGSAVVPRPRGQDELAEDGRGYAIVAALVESWGVEELPEGKRVWACFPPYRIPSQDPPPRLTGTAQ